MIHITAPVELLHERFSYDPESGALIVRAPAPPSRLKAGDPISKTNQKGYLIVTVLGHSMFVHRIAWAMHYGIWPEGILDHINQCKTDNRISNLRPASVAQNTANQSGKAYGGRKGIYKRPASWAAQIRANGINRYLGSFPTLDEAAHAYNKAAIQHFGEFAVLNPLGADKV